MRVLGDIFAVAIVVIATAAAGRAVHWFLTRRELRLHPPPGTLVDVDGTRMHLVCMGTGDVTVLLESGLSGTYLDWSKVQPSVAQHTRVCAYDRVGLGYSDWSSGGVDSETVARRLHRLLEIARISGPFILVGHSYGGIHMRTFARLYPAESAGLVLVDSSHENQLRFLPAEAVSSPLLVDALFRAGPLLSQIGLYRLLKVPRLLAGSLNLPAKAKAQARRLMQPTKAWRAMLAEYRMSRIETNQEDPPRLPANIPLTVITQGNGAGSDFQHLQPALRDEVSRIWLELQRRLADLSEDSTSLIASGTSHYIQLDDPECVVRSIVEMLSRSA